MRRVLLLFAVCSGACAPRGTTNPLDETISAAPSTLVFRGEVRALVGTRPASVEGILRMRGADGRDPPARWTATPELLEVDAPFGSAVDVELELPLITALRSLDGASVSLLGGRGARLELFAGGGAEVEALDVDVDTAVLVAEGGTVAATGTARVVEARAVDGVVRASHVSAEVTRVDADEASELCVAARAVVHGVAKRASRVRLIGVPRVVQVTPPAAVEVVGNGSTPPGG